MKKPLSYNLTEDNHKALKREGKSVGSASFWLNRHLTDFFSSTKAKAPPVKARFDFKNSVLGLGVDVETLNDWLTVRKKKKAANTQTAFNSLLTEIKKSGLHPQQAIHTAASNSWSGFKAEWVKENNSQGGKTSGNLKACEDFING